MVGIPRTHHRRFAYEKDRHHQSSSCCWRSGNGRSCGRHRRRRGSAELHDEHHSVHEQHGDDAIDKHHTVDDSAVADSTLGIAEPPLPEHGQKVRLRIRLGFEFGFGL
jgi:hypothetical protein